MPVDMSDRHPTRGTDLILSETTKGKGNFKGEGGNIKCTNVLQEKKILNLKFKRPVSQPIHDPYPSLTSRPPPNNHEPFVCIGSLLRIFSSIPSRELIAFNLEFGPEAPSFLFYLPAATPN